jgi:hypothetical protein
MTFANPSSATETSARSETSHPSIRARLDAATMALLQTRDQVIKSLDKHLSELHFLRLALAEADNAAIGNDTTSAPALSASVSNAQPHDEPLGSYGLAAQPSMILPGSRHDIESTQVQAAPQPPRDMLNALQGLQNALLMKTPLTPQPVPMAEVFPDHLHELQAHPSPAVAASLAMPTSFSVPVGPAPAAEPAVTHLPPPLLPAAHPGFAFPTPQDQYPQPQPQFQPPASAVPMRQMQQPFTLPPAVSQVSSASVMVPSMDGRSLLSSPPLAPTHFSFHQHPMPPLAASGISADVAREARIDSQMEQATLEDLNVALAFAFSQVSSPSQPLPSPTTMAVHQPHREAPQQAAPPQWQLPQRA